jgi:hypothetical protein
MTAYGPITDSVAQQKLRERLLPLVGVEVSNLRIPIDVAEHFEPSQVGTIVGTLTDALLPSIAERQKVGLKKSAGILGDREGYPDFDHVDGYRVELKGLFKNNPKVKLKSPPTPREPSARLTQKVTVKNVVPETDALLVLVYQLDHYSANKGELVPKVVDVGIFPVIECISARDYRLKHSGGRWFGSFETPAVLSKHGWKKLTAFFEMSKTEIALKIQEERLLLEIVESCGIDLANYGRKQSEKKDYNEDTNFGKLKRIPYEPLHRFLKGNGASYASKGGYPTPWKIDDSGSGDDDEDILE